MLTFWYIMRRNFIVWELILCQVHKDSIFPLVKFEREDNLLQSPSHHLKIFEVSLNEMHCSSLLCVHRCRGDDRRQTSSGLRSAVMRKKHEKSKNREKYLYPRFPRGWSRDECRIGHALLLALYTFFRDNSFFAVGNDFQFLYLYIRLIRVDNSLCGHCWAISSSLKWDAFFRSTNNVTLSDLPCKKKMIPSIRTTRANQQFVKWALYTWQWLFLFIRLVSWVDWQPCCRAL